MTTCRCGGPFRADLQYLSDAKRFGLQSTVPLLLKCFMCGRSLWIEPSVPAKRAAGSLLLTSPTAGLRAHPG